MKKHFYLLLFFFAIVLCSQAQIKKGDILLGGNFGFSTSSSNPSNGKQSNFNVSPHIGKAVQDNLVVGINLIYGHNSSSNMSYTSKGDFYGAGIFVRKYKYLGSGFSVFMEGGLGGTYNKQDNINPTGYTSNKTKTYSINAHFDPGVAYAISKRVQVETGFQDLVTANYSHSKNTDYDISTPGNSSNYSSDSFSLGANLSSVLNNFIVGFRLLLN
jgi:hypothetical protein